MFRGIILFFSLSVSFVAVATPKIGDGAPAFALDTLDGKSIDSAWLLGQVTLVEFFATWCAPCRENLDDLQAVQKEFGNRVRALVIAVDEPDKVRAFLKEHPQFKQVAWAVDTRGEVALRWGEERLPTTFFLDKEATIRHINRGHGTGFQRRAMGWLRGMLGT